jgi:hypothetical protein
MRVLGILGLLVALAIVGLIAKKQLTAPAAPATASVPGGPAIDTTAAPKQQVDQFKQAVESAVQQPRPVPDEPK